MAHQTVDVDCVKDIETRDMRSSLQILKVYKRRARRPMVPELSDEIVFEILVHLPVKDLMQFKSVSKAWHTIISDPIFIRMHLQQSARNHEQTPTFIVTPHTLDRVNDHESWPTTFSNYIPFYLWQKGQDKACLVHSSNFNGEFGSVYLTVHCDGLVMLPTNTKVYVFNPATHDVLRLCYGQKDKWWSNPTVGLGLDTRTNKYKIVRFFYCSLDFSKRTYRAGIEIFTIGIDTCWRSIMEVPFPFKSGEPTHFKGSLYLLIWNELLERPAQGLLRFNLDDETFSFIRYPKLLASKAKWLDLIELGGELCLVQCHDGELVVWMLQSSDRQEWVQHCVISLSEAWKFKAFRVMPKGGMLVRRANCLYHYDDSCQYAKEVDHLDRLCYKNAREVVHRDQLRYNNPKVGTNDFVGQHIFLFNIVPYVESLVPVRRDSTSWMVAN